ncbi:MAG: hypothetical protein J6P46_00255, partial [Bacteroidales bacterium]|nr:hypothetical protein [Bacteroidales bacterium]
MPTAEMQQDGTFMITNNFLNKHALPTSGWGYNTFQYGFAVSFWGRVEMGYVCTIFNGAWDPRPEEDKGRYWSMMRNQDRHFTGRILLLKEGDGFEWIPALVFGISDPTTGSGGDYSILDGVEGIGNGYFNRKFFVLSKHFQAVWGEIGVHAGYQFNRRTDYAINAPCVGMSWKPFWLQNKGILNCLDIIVEYDSRTVNTGFLASIWDNRLEVMIDLK